ncbi:MAG: type VI secretion protein [Pseudomonas sp. PGPPP1]|uniref:type VI secretion system-associated FHA domain protein TagH n=1 Tax=Pseudomonas sp. PGPPP1 TaxID=2015553 RepID=UPI000BCA77B9|nr:type VI secretion system-associated FHA domain protein TagH [Pseudomonas sp. PGPPP1]OYU09075.1 MAG: type VI secretion protein [Pseudomonas sp. PGPPP1]
MQLVFEVCDTASGEPPAEKTFDGVGGVIGRGAACDWIIADPRRLMSSHHGLVSYRDGQYFLTDISSNGIGIGDGPERLHRGQVRLICEGDIYQLGSVSIRARLVGHVRQAFVLGELIPDDLFLGVDPVRALDREQRRTESSVELDALNTAPAEPAFPRDHGVVDRDHLVVPKWAEPVEPLYGAQPATVAPVAQDAFWFQFGTALGMPLDSLDYPGREALAIKVASLLRQTIDGLQQSLRTRDELTGDLKMSATTSAQSSHHLLRDCTDSQSALAALLVGGELRPLSAEQEVAHAYREMQAHQLALVAACRATVRSALGAFAPGHLLLCFEREGKRSRFSTDGAHWRAYQRHYQRLVNQDCLAEQLFRHDFSDAYREQVRLVSTLHAAYPG